jgi:hypothetical protein
MPTPDLAAVLACPRCGERPVEASDGSFACTPCGQRFPLVGGVPALFADPAASLGEWRNREQFLLDTLARDVARAQAELANPRLRPLTRERLQLLAQAWADQARRLRELLAPLGLAGGQPGYATHLALRTRLPPDQGLTTYEANVFRDWAWGDAENDRTASLVLAALGSHAPGVVGVLGAGAGRLAYDLHRRARPALTVALDFNPLLLLVAARVLAGAGVELWEFPLAPRTLADHAVLRQLAAPEPPPEGLELLLADALRPPFRPGSLDTLVAPWVVDILPDDFRSQVLRANQLLAPGGRLVIFGSLAFGGPELATRYALEEVLALVMDAGFGEPEVQEAEIPYLCSPASRHGRRETVLTIAATRVQDAPAPPRHRALPDWLVTGTQPVPLLPAFQSQAMATRIYAFLMGLIDGRRSVKDMAKLLADQRLMTREDAEPAVRSFLLRMYDDAQREGSGYR